MKTRLKFLDRYLTLWIFLAMLIGLLFGNWFPQLAKTLFSSHSGSINVSLAIGLIIMMYPPLAKVNYRLIPKVFADKKTLGLSLLLNWVVGPLLMFGLALAFMPGEPDYRSGLILIGLARCIAMVIVWNDLAHGNREYAAALVALNSIFQIFFYSFYAWLFMEQFPELLGLATVQVEVSFKLVAESVLLYLGLPFALGLLSRIVLPKIKSKEWFERKFIPTISPLTLIALLFTIVAMFSLKADQVVELPLDVLQISLPLLSYFLLMFVLAFFFSKAFGAKPDVNAAISFTASGNNFELAIAVAIAVFGINSQQAFVGVIGPLVEVPALILLVQLFKFLKKRYYTSR